MNPIATTMQPPDQTATTKFHTDAEVVVSEPLSVKHLSADIYRPSQVAYRQSIEEFLAKPVVIQSGALNALDTVTTYGQIPLPYNALITSIFSNKLDGFLGFRATTVIRIDINATRFQQGRYMLAWVPTGGAQASKASTQLSFNYHINSLTARTQLQRIEMDLACDTAGTMRIPFNSALNFYPFSALQSASGYGCLGILNLFPYVPVSAGSGSTNPSYTIWCSFEDIELIGPAGPQSGRVTKGKSKTEVEQESHNIGPISSALVKVSNASHILGEIPLLSAFTAPIGWVSDVLARTASVFGWSKPANLDTTKRVIREISPNYFHYDAADDSLILAASARNQVDNAVGFSGNDIDELDFGFIKTIPAYLNQFSWTTANAAGVALYQQYVSPFATVNTRTQFLQTVNDYLPMQYVANFFQLWRGSIVFTFKIIKTEFHSGRLAIAYFPYDDNDRAVQSSYLNSNYVFREIIDIRLQNEVTITIPYINSMPWRPLNGGATTPGRLSVYIVDPLVAPSTVSSSVTIVVEVAGGPDLEFAVPSNSLPTQAIMGITPQSGVDKVVPNDCALVEEVIGGAKINPANVASTALCIGESITSFRQLLKLNHLMPANNYTPAKYLNLIPFGLPVVFVGALVNQYPNIYGDLYASLGALYLYSRGGVRFKIFSTIPVAQSTPSRCYISYANASTALKADMMLTGASDGLGNTTSDQMTFTPTTFHHVTQNQCAEIMIPQYHRFASRVNSDHFVGFGVDYIYTARSLSSRSILTYTNGVGQTVTNPIISRSGADDVNFGCFISVGPMIATGTTNVI